MCAFNIICQNNGICNFNRTSNVYSCQCVNNYYGNNCQFQYLPLNSTTFINSTILSQENGISLMTLIKVPFFSRATRVYQASKDGFGASNFHSKVDGVLGTLTVIKSTNGNSNIITSYNHKKNNDMKNLNNDIMLKNFNYISLGYLDNNPLLNSGTILSKNKSNNKLIDVKNNNITYKKINEEEKKINHNNHLDENDYETANNNLKIKNINSNKKYKNSYSKSKNEKNNPFDNKSSKDVNNNIINTNNYKSKQNQINNNINKKTTRRSIKQ